VSAQVDEVSNAIRDSVHTGDATEYNTTRTARSVP